MLKSLLTAVLVVLIPTVALADLTLIQKVEVKQENMWDPTMNQTEEHVETIYIKGKKIRIDAKDNKTYTLVDFEKGVFYTISPEEKTYSEIPLSDLAKLRDIAFYQIKTKLDQLDNLKPEQKAALEMMYGPMFKKLREELENKDKPTKVEVEHPEETKEIAGHKCSHMIIREDGEVVLDLWLTQEIDAGVNLAQVLSSVALFPETVKKEIREIKGFSLSTTYVFNLAGQKSSNSSETKELKTDELPVEKFEVPEGYKKIESNLSDSIKQYDKWMKEQEKKSAEKEENGEAPKEPQEKPEQKPQEQKQEEEQQEGQKEQEAEPEKKEEQK